MTFLSVAKVAKFPIKSGHTTVQLRPLTIDIRTDSKF